MATKARGPLGGEGKAVEVDETYIGGKEKNKHVGKRTRRNIGGQGKAVVFALVERDGESQGLSMLIAESNEVYVADLLSRVFRIERGAVEG